VATQRTSRQRTLIAQLFFFMIVLPCLLAAYLFAAGGSTVIAWVVLVLAVSDVFMFAYIVRKVGRGEPTTPDVTAEPPAQTLKRLNEDDSQ
jgi:hypothetical protein